MKIIWIDGTFGIGKSAVAAAIVEEIPQAHLLEFDALQEKYKPTSVSDYFGKRYPEAKKYNQENKTYKLLTTKLLYSMFLINYYIGAFVWK